jgi:bifunctional non-homologous end joining protein LigD
MFEEAGIKPFLKTTGSRGLHIILSLEPEHTFSKTRKLAKAIADKLAAQHPDLLTTEMSKDERGDRVFVDYLRNGFAQTAIAPYSVRAKENAPVSAPISRVNWRIKR